MTTADPDPSRLPPWFADAMVATHLRFGPGVHFPGPLEEALIRATEECLIDLEEHPDDARRCGSIFRGVTDPASPWPGRGILAGVLKSIALQKEREAHRKDAALLALAALIVLEDRDPEIQRRRGDPRSQKRPANLPCVSEADGKKEELTGDTCSLPYLHEVVTSGPADFHPGVFALAQEVLDRGKPVNDDAAFVREHRDLVGACRLRREHAADRDPIWTFGSSPKSVVVETGSREQGSQVQAPAQPASSFFERLRWDAHELSKSGDKEGSRKVEVIVNWDNERRAAPASFCAETHGSVAPPAGSPTGAFAPPAPRQTHVLVYGLRDAGRKCLWVVVAHRAGKTWALRKRRRYVEHLKLLIESRTFDLRSLGPDYAKRFEGWVRDGCRLSVQRDGSNITLEERASLFVTEEVYDPEVTLRRLETDHHFDTAREQFLR